jgi:hypothetical protein
MAGGGVVSEWNREGWNSKGRRKQQTQAVMSQNTGEGASLEADVEVGQVDAAERGGGEGGITRMNGGGGGGGLTVVSHAFDSPHESLFSCNTHWQLSGGGGGGGGRFCIDGDTNCDRESQEERDRGGGQKQPGGREMTVSRRHDA